jgi:hypothetical protein
VTVAPDFVATSQNSFVYWRIETRPLPAAEEEVAYGAYRASMWPLVALTLIMIGLIDVATHLHHW